MFEKSPKILNDTLTMLKKGIFVKGMVIIRLKFRQELFRTRLRYFFFFVKLEHSRNFLRRISHLDTTRNPNQLGRKFQQIESAERRRDGDSQRRFVWGSSPTRVEMRSVAGLFEFVGLLISDFWVPLELGGVRKNQYMELLFSFGSPVLEVFN